MDWLKLLSLTLPHLCEELWQISGNKDFISKSYWDDFNLNYINKEIEEEYNYISTLIDDILSIKKIIKTQNNEIYLYTAPNWKYEVFNVVITHKGDFNSIISELKKYPNIIRNKELIPFVKNQIKNRVWESNYFQMNEIELLKQYQAHIEKKVNLNIILNSDFDPQKKSHKAMPFKPALFVDVN